ncbi:MAG: PIG-L family deacetylase [Anaerolineales bacterium]|nr:PIG-L family deacetylase [Anaerolineales bacterium]
MPEATPTPAWRILALAAHADDLEILCAGTLARWVHLGHRLTMATATWCKFGSYDLSLDECSRVRHTEAAASAARIGADYHALMIPDNTVNPYDADQQRLVVDLIRRVRPDVIVTHAANDYHTDHVNLSQLVLWAGPILGIAQYETGHPALDYTPALYWMDTLNGQGFQPTEFVDITATLPTKIAMLESFESQIPFLKRYFEMDIIEQVQTTARYRGIQAGVRYAEAFRRYQGAGWGNLTIRYLP